ncbi:tyrosine-type recombinase/integrase [Candidatus Pelagibacter sp. HIMB1517]|uniref:tyrosine-type recombinase/integrase n=1 Tax=Candidatus Pelagibacter sp. HIMB1517 TaxID=3413341 RepID=UPI003F83D0BC
MKNEINVFKTLETETLENIRQSRAYNTSRAYKADFKDFINFCKNINKKPIKADIKDVSIYLTYLSKKNLKFSTIKRRLVSIVVANRMAGNHIDTKHPIINENLKTIKRKIGAIQIGKKPISLIDLKKIILKLNDNKNININKKIRDKAIILVGFAGGFRRSELVNLNYQDIEFVKEGVKILLRKSKTDQYSEGFVKALPHFSNSYFCPVISLKNWLDKSLIKNESVFRKISKSGKISNNQLTDQSVALILKYHMSQANLDPTNFSGHSLRSGFATATANSGADERSIMAMTGHKSTQMVRRYIKEANLFKNNALNKIDI